MTREKVELTVTLVSFQPNAIHDDFLDGSHQALHLAILEVVAPAELRGHRLNVVHSDASEQAPAWEEFERHFVVELESWILNTPAMDVPAEAITIVSGK